VSVSATEEVLGASKGLDVAHADNSKAATIAAPRRSQALRGLDGGQDALAIVVFKSAFLQVDDRHLGGTRGVYVERTVLAIGQPPTPGIGGSGNPWRANRSEWQACVPDARSIGC
jgi:hypothetical protein